MPSPLALLLEKALGSPVVGSRPMRGGDIADVSCLTLKDGRKVVAKRPRADQPDTTATEAMMLNHLAAHSPVPVPRVLFQSAGILVMEHVAHAGVTDAVKASESVAIHVAALHDCLAGDAPKPYGFTEDTFIGPLNQRNKQSANWASFFRDHRLLAMAQSCLRTSRFEAGMMARIEAIAAKLPTLLPGTPPASLLHGDLWAGNMLIDGDRAAGFIDPAISYGHAEMDLAFIALMGGLERNFFDAYAAHRAIEPGFFEDRIAIYQLWPLLVHVRLFGGGYVGQVSHILDRFGV
ncbi:fructosamine kinase family protein [Kordiimonas gwangyangensis]|uniref:fructosamine kinase family protein n=1 Tax=Kordiimonas gwangyangensis TaxID=288022 RepID=UPI0003A9ED1B|nr:fructosamine kinase family protein [Kordiimonas gwangyangensis]